MATPIPEKRYKAKYKCKFCEETWTAKDTSHLKMICINSKCKKLIRPYKFEVIDKLVIYRCVDCAMEIKLKKCSSEVNKDIPCCPICRKKMIVHKVKDLWPKKRMFGHYRCEECLHEWKSGNAWEGVGQQCRKCKVEILPYRLDPLLNHFNPERISKGEPHQQDLCEMCKKLGHNCKDYVPPNDNVASPDEIPEDTGTDITTNSSIDDGNDDHDSDVATDDVDDDLDDDEAGVRTPVMRNQMIYRQVPRNDRLHELDENFRKFKLEWEQS